MLREDVRILIVDDVTAMRVQVSEILSAHGYKKLTAVGSVDEAKAILNTDKFHLILCDWHMSPDDGIALLKYVRSQSSLKDVAFMMVTAESTKERVVEAIQSGIDDYLIKPVTLEHVQTKIHDVLVKRKVLSI
jgi:two-component system, chemotaxis family, chemotaxis protein CheY